MIFRGFGFWLIIGKREVPKENLLNFHVFLTRAKMLMIGQFHTVLPKVIRNDSFSFSFNQNTKSRQWLFWSINLARKLLQAVMLCTGFYLYICDFNGLFPNIVRINWDDLINNTNEVNPTYLVTVGYEKTK